MTNLTAEMLKPMKDLHRQAMILANNAFAAKSRGATTDALALFTQAYGLEANAARKVAAFDAAEPTRSILLRSAASLAYNAGLNREAEQLACLALSGEPTDDVAAELRELLEEINMARHLVLHGVVLEDSELQIVFTGPEVKKGLANSEQVFRKVRHTETLLSRTNDRLSSRPFLDGIDGAASKSVPLRTYLGVGEGSLAVTLRVGIPTEQLALDLNEREGTRFVMDEFLGCLELFQLRREEELRARIPDDDYYQNFVIVAKHIAPDGKSFNMVGFTLYRNGVPRYVSLTPREKDVAPFFISAPGRAELNADKAIEREAITGYLRIADSRTAKHPAFTIIDDSHRPYRVITPPGVLRDIVRPYFEERVTVTVRREKSRTHRGNPTSRLLFEGIDQAVAEMSDTSK